jgi:hypothetical protein
MSESTPPERVPQPPTPTETVGPVSATPPSKPPPPPPPTPAEVGAWTRERKEAGTRIDPNTAEIWWLYTRILDPYDDGIDPPEDAVGQTWFAMDPVERIPVYVGDLPDETHRLIDAKICGPLDSRLPATPYSS